MNYENKKENSSSYQKARIDLEMYYKEVMGV
jgi:hypothetical protein